MESQRNCSVRDLLRSAREAVKDEPPLHPARGVAATQGKKSPRVPPAGGLSKINRHISPPPQPQHRSNDLETADARRVHSAPSPTPHGREHDDERAEMPLPPPPGQAQPFAVYATNDGEATGFDSSSSDDDEISSEKNKAPEAKLIEKGNAKTPRSGHDDAELPTTTEHQEVSSKQKTGQPRAPATEKPSASGESPRKGMGTSPPPTTNEKVVARLRVGGGSATELPLGFSTDPKVAEARSQLEAVLRGETNTAAANSKDQHKKPREGTEKKGGGAGAAGGQLFGETARTIASGGALLNLNRQFGSSEEDAAARAARKLMGLDEASRGAEGGDIASAASMTVAEACKPLGDLMPIDVTDRIHSLHSRVGEIGNATNVPDSGRSGNNAHGSVGSPAPSPASPTTGAEEAGALVVRSGNSPPRAPLDGGAQESSPTTDQRREADAILHAFLSSGSA